jgi:putative hemolysin
VGGYYSENEFDLTRLQHLRSRLVEIGRSCIDADYRSGAVIALLWSGLARYMQENGYDYLIGCASVSMADGGHTAASLYNRLREKHLARSNTTSSRAARCRSAACAATSRPRRRR